MGVMSRSSHSFYVPVMGTGFMIDAPLRIAKYGISSTISLVDDVLIEQMRRFHCERSGHPYKEIASSEEDARARRITAYLDLLNCLVSQQVAALRQSRFEAGSEITRYFELLPKGPLADQYRAMLATSDPQMRCERQGGLRELAVPGSINVNIMSKGDRDAYRHGEKLPPQYSDASAALRGFAQSELASSIVFSAGMNPRLYSYAAEFPDFFPDKRGQLKKHIVLKVSDFHSAAVQGRFLAKRGLWVSEYHVESGLNCGGHAFATKGLLLGPILEEFQRRKAELIEQLFETYAKALRAGGSPWLWSRIPFASRRKAGSARLKRTGCCGSTTAQTPRAGPRRFCSCPKSPTLTTSTAKNSARQITERFISATALRLDCPIGTCATRPARMPGDAVSTRAIQAVLARRATSACSTGNSPTSPFARRHESTSNSNWNNYRIRPSPKSNARRC